MGGRAGSFGYLRRGLLCVAVVLLLGIATIGCGGSSSSETITGKSYTVGTKLGERGPSPFDPTELSGPLAEELEAYLIKNYEAESWFPHLEDVWSNSGTAIVAADFDRNAESEKLAEKVCVIVRDAPVKHHASTIMVHYAYGRSVEC